VGALISSVKKTVVHECSSTIRFTCAARGKHACPSAASSQSTKAVSFIT
jgi:hypothetical protein